MAAYVRTPASLWHPHPTSMLLPDWGEVHVWRASLQQPAEEVARLGRLLAPDEQAKASRFHFRRDRERFAVARGTLRSILSLYLKVEPEQLRFEYSRYGKPGLPEEFGGGALRFNISHSHKMALFAVARGRELGVDIEYLREDFAGEQIARHFFSPREVASLRSLPQGQRTEAFFRCWTRKEAYVKAIGEGLSMPLDEFDVSLLPGEPVALLSNRRRPQEVLRWSLQAIDVDFDYVAAIAVEGHDWRLKCWDWGEEPCARTRIREGLSESSDRTEAAHPLRSQTGQFLSK